MKQTHRSQDIDVKNLDLAAMLVTLHFRLRVEEPISLIIDEHGKKHFTAHFQAEAEHDVFGTLTASQVLGIWSDDADHRSVSDPMLVEVIDHMREQRRARNTFLDIIRPKEQGGQGLVRARLSFPIGDGWRGSLPADASPDLERRFAAMVAAVV